MGHASIETTMDIYAEVTEMTKKEALDNLSANLIFTYFIILGNTFEETLKIFDNTE